MACCAFSNLGTVCAALPVTVSTKSLIIGNAARRLAALLRLAVLLNRAHEDDPLPALELTADDNRLSLIVPQAFIDARPLLRADLIGETDGIAGLGIQFRPFVA